MDKLFVRTTLFLFITLSPLNLFADKLSECLGRLQTKQHTMLFGNPQIRRSLTDEEKQMLRDFTKIHTRFEDDPSAFEKLFNEADAVSDIDTVRQVISLMDYHMESGKSMNTIRAELDAIKEESKSLWSSPKRGAGFMDLQPTADWNSLIIFQRAKNQNEAAWKKLSQFLMEKGDSPLQAASKIEVLLDNNSFDGNFQLRYAELEKALEVKSNSIGIVPKEITHKPTSNEVFTSYILYLGLIRPKGKDLNDLKTAIATAKEDHASSINNVGNLLHWTMKNLTAEESSDKLRIGGRIISIQQFLQPN